MRKPRSFDKVEEANRDTGAVFRKKYLWNDVDVIVDISCEKNVLAGVILPVAVKYGMPLMVTTGFSSGTFASEAVAARRSEDKLCIVHYFGDFEWVGQDGAKSIEAKLKRFAANVTVDISFHTVAVTQEQVDEIGLPTRTPKRVASTDKKWPHDRACELDAISPDYLHELVDGCISLHMPPREVEILKVAERSERYLMLAWAHAAEEELCDGGLDQ